MIRKKENAISSDDTIQRVIDLLPTRIFWKDKKCIYLGCNKAFAMDAGKKNSKYLIGKTDFQMTWKKQAKLYFADDMKVIKSGKAKINFEEPQTTPKGDEIWLRTSKFPLLDSNNKIVGVIGMYDDITQIKKAEEALKKREKILNEVGDIAKIGGWEMNLITRKAEWTKATYDIICINYKKTPPGPDEHVNYYVKEDQQIVRDAMNNLIKNNVPLDFEARANIKGKIKWVHALGKGSFKDGKCIKITGTLQDITKIKESEELTLSNTEEIKKFNKIAIDRELKMIELKNEIAELKKLLDKD